jgi:prepilin-type N-terminal cleavage/methylation domain-containing protein
MSKRTTAQRGFTLIELMVTMAIMSVVIGGSIAGFITFQSRQQVVEVGKTVQQLVRTAQGKARVRETPTNASCNGSAGARLQGYRITFASNVSVIYALCGADGSIRGGGSLAQVEVYREDIAGVTYAAGSPSSIDFYTLYRGLDYTSGTKRIQYSSTDGVVVYFDVTAGGAISEVTVN